MAEFERVRDALCFDVDSCCGSRCACLPLPPPGCRGERGRIGRSPERRKRADLCHEGFLSTMERSEAQKARKAGVPLAALHMTS